MLPGTIEWDCSLIDSIFPNFEAQAIRRLQPSTEDDRLLWLPLTSGTFSCKSAYTGLTLQQASSSKLPAADILPSEPSFRWARFWRMQGVAPRALLFVWRALLGGIAVGSVLHRRLQTPDTCHLCSSSPETVSHLFINCAFAQHVWRLSGIPLPSRASSLELPQFFNQLWELHGESTMKLVVSILWSIWKSRNAVIFNQEPCSAERCHEKALRFYMEYDRPSVIHVELDHPPPSHPPPMRKVHWMLPPEGFIKVNVDAAFDRGRGAAGVVARSHTGACLGGTAEVFQASSALQAEAKAFVLGFKWLADMNFTKVILEGDSKIMTDSITQSHLPDWHIRQEVFTCRNFLNTFVNVSVMHVSRSCNGVAHALAKFSSACDTNCSWSGGLPPPPLLDPLFADLATVVLPDFI